MNCGIVGLPNVGKSTLFNALTKMMLAEVANYPFCTIEPNVGRVSVPDYRLKKLAQMVGSQKIIYNQLEFVDIAGLVKGASTGEGLGNKFLGHIRDVDAIIHVLRCFENKDISHVNNKVSPLNDAEIIELELIFADIESLEKRLPALEKSKKSGDKDAKSKLDIISGVLEVLKSGKMAQEFKYASPEELKNLQLITTKPMMYVCNVEETNAATGNNLTKLVQEMANNCGRKSFIISAKLESDIASFDDESEKNMILSEYGLQESGLDSIIKGMYDLLEMMTFFTIGPKEARAWQIKNNTTASSAAGVIHTDFEKGFIKAETISYNDYISCGGEAACKEMGKVRFEGRDYIVQDGDIIHFRFNN